MRQSIASGSQGSFSRSAAVSRAQSSRVCLHWKMKRSPAMKGRNTSQVISSAASCRSTLSSAWSARASKAVVRGAPQEAPRSAISFRNPFAAARKSGALEAKYSSLEAGYGSRKVSIQFSKALRFPSATRSSILRRL